MIRTICLCVCLLYFTNNSKGQLQKEGLVNFVSMVAPEGFRGYTWFKDSIVIFEQYQHYSESLNGSIISEGSRIFKYTILDISSMRGQDYFTFSDTATPVTNYQVKNTDDIFGRFNIKEHPYDKYMDSMIQISDTIIEEKKYKRLYFDLSDTGWHQRLTYYIICSEVDNIFHLDRKIDDKYPGCKVTQVQYTDMLTGISEFNKLQNIRDSLNHLEQKVFNKWKSNMEFSKLPVTSYDEAMELFGQLFSDKNP